MLYVPCAGPVLAAIIVAGATSTVGLNTVILTCAFAVGAAVPLLFFALAGRQVAERVNTFRRRQRAIRIGAGIVTILLAVALVFDLPAMLQRAIPDYTSALQRRLGGEDQIREKLNLGGIVNDQNAKLSNCTNGAPQLEDCGSAPDIKGITAWLNTPGDKPIDLPSLRGSVVLVDFWAYSCINCQRAIPHVMGWYRAYKDSGFEVIGVHTPEYAFEKVPDNVASGAADLGITYPVALDNDWSTWTNYRNRYWPAEYLIDANGTVRHIKFGEGDYDATEKLIRQLLVDANRGAQLPAPVDAADRRPPRADSRDLFRRGQEVNFAAAANTTRGPQRSTTRRRCPPTPSRSSGPWSLDNQGATPDSDDSRIRLNYHAKKSTRRRWHGTVTVTRDGKSTTLAVAGTAGVAPSGGRRAGYRRDARGAAQPGPAGVFVHLRMI